MSAYFDSGLLVKLYVPERNTLAAETLLQQLSQPLIFTHLHRLEVTNAIHAKCFRSEITRAEADQSLALMENDLATGRLQSTSPDWEEIFDRADELVKQHTSVLGTRSLDVLHVALALVLNIHNFATSDQRQAKLAEKVGLQLFTL